jgi:hypothetical protein
MCWLAGAMLAGLLVSAVDAAEGPLLPEGPWRGPLARAEAALADGQPRRAEQAWEEARRAAMRATAPSTGLVDVGLAYLRIGEAAHDRQTAVARARQLFLRALFRARARRDVDGMTAAGQAFARLGDCEMSGRAFAIVRTVAPRHAAPPAVCERGEASRQPSASPRGAPDLRAP